MKMDSLSKTPDSSKTQYEQLIENSPILKAFAKMCPTDPTMTPEKRNRVINAIVELGKPKNG